MECLAAVSSQPFFVRDVVADFGAFRAGAVAVEFPDAGIDREEPAAMGAASGFFLRMMGFHHRKT